MMSPAAPRTLSPKWRRIVREVFLEQVFLRRALVPWSSCPEAPWLCAECRVVAEMVRRER